MRKGSGVVVNNGDKFNNFTVVKCNVMRGSNRYHKCKCVCGNIKTVYHHNLIHNKSKSCGCIQKKNPPSKTHGMSKTKEYSTWSRMLARCRNKNIERYKNYGGRGIKVCKRWLSFENFYNDMGDKPEGHSIGRIDNDGDYEPGNVEWQNRKIQMNNTTRNIYINWNGQRKTLMEWCDYYGLDYSRIQQRYQVGILPPKLFNKKHLKFKMITINGETRKTTEWMKLIPIPISSFYHFKRKGLTEEEIVKKYMD